MGSCRDVRKGISPRSCKQRKGQKQTAREMVVASTRLTDPKGRAKAWLKGRPGIPAGWGSQNGAEECQKSLGRCYKRSRSRSRCRRELNCGLDDSVKKGRAELTSAVGLQHLAVVRGLWAVMISSPPRELSMVDDSSKDLLLREGEMQPI
jgi:hypothetical protein